MTLNKKRPQPDLDDLDFNILKALSQDAKMSYADLGKKVNLTGPAVHGRVKKMENLGVIKQYGIDIDFNLIGLPVCAFVRVQTGKLSCRDAAKLVETFDEVIECHAVAGEDDLLLKTRTATPLDLQELLDRLKTQGIIVNSVSLFVLETHFERARL